MNPGIQRLLVKALEYAAKTDPKRVKAVYDEYVTAKPHKPKKSQKSPAAPAPMIQR